MLEIQKELDQFILTIKNTQVYKEYQLQKSKVKENPDLKRQLDQFRMRNYELQTKHCPDNLYDEMDCFQREYEQFRESRWCMIFWQRSLRSAAWYRKYRMV